MTLSFEQTKQLIAIDAGLEAIRQERQMLDIREEHLWERRSEIAGDVGGIALHALKDVRVIGEAE